jgi:hypothetical protein
MTDDELRLYDWWRSNLEEENIVEGKGRCIPAAYEILIVSFSSARRVANCLNLSERART